MRPSIRGLSSFAVVLIAASSTVFATSCLDLKVETDPSGAGGSGSSSADASSSSAEASSSSSASASSSSSNSSSSSSGMGAICGNSVVDAGEQCDDGNTSAGDGCSSSCQLESTDGCPGEMIEISSGQKLGRTGSTVNHKDTFTGAKTGPIGNCGNGNWTGPDAIYMVTPKANGNLVVTADFSYSESMLHIRSQCPATANEQLACHYQFNAGAATLTLPVTQDGVYYVAVDAFNGQGGSYTVTFALQ